MRSLLEIQEMLRTAANPVLSLSDEEIDALSDNDMDLLREEFGSTVLLKLPPREQAFMDWLKKEEPAIYRDVWDDDEDMLVSLSFLPEMREGGSGFVICELTAHDNYFFSRRHIKPAGMQALPGIINKIEKAEEVAIGEVLMFEVLRSSTDIWHFCYRYGVDLQRGREVVAALVSHQWLVHLPEREDLISYLDDE